MSPPASLSVVMPVHNELDSVEQTLRLLRRAAAVSPWADCEVVVVDDGSNDGTAALLDSLAAELRLTVVHQANAGRLDAREVGLRTATTELVLLLDARVHLDPAALTHLAEQLLLDPAAVLWNGHVTVATRGNPYAAFWSALTTLGWRRYFSDPRRTSFGLEDFDRYPKGTGAFVAPRVWLLADSVDLDVHYDNRSLASDDTALLRRLAGRSRIHLSPGFSCTYYGRQALTPFVRHAYFRGTTFVDGYLGRGGQVGRVLVVALLATPPAAVLAVRRPRSAGTLAGLGAAGLGAAAVRAGAPVRDGAALTALLPVFGVAFGGGVVRGLLLATLARVRRRVRPGAGR